MNARANTNQLRSVYEASAENAVEPVVFGITIRRDEAGRYCLNDLHKAAVASGLGGDSSHRDCNAFFDKRYGKGTEIAETLDAELQSAGNHAFKSVEQKRGRYGGTFVAKELVYAYAMWISPKFHLEVIRFFDKGVTQGVAVHHNAAEDLLNNPLKYMEVLLSQAKEIKLERDLLAAKVEEQTPKVMALQRIAEATGSSCLTAAAKSLQMKPKDLFSFMSHNKWIYRRPGGTWLGYQDKIQSGMIEHKVTTIRRDDGSEKIVEQVRLTPKGMARLSEILSAYH